MAAAMMKAAVVHAAGPPSVLKLMQIPIPSPQPGQVLIRVKAFGLNRSELFPLLGHSSGVKFPRVLGIEAVGLVEDAPGCEFEKGIIVATAMGGMGRNFDGGYADFTCIPAGQVQAITGTTKLAWEVRSAAPEMLQTVYGALVKALRLERGGSLAHSGRNDVCGACGGCHCEIPGCICCVDESEGGSGGDAQGEWGGSGFG